MSSRRKAFLAALRDPDTRVSAAAAQALDRLDALAAAPEQVARRTNLSVAEWVALVRSLANTRDESCLKLALLALDHPHEDVRLAALDLIAAFRDRRGTVRVEETLADPQPVVRERAASVLGELGDRRCAPRLLDLLADPAPGVVAQAATALGLLGFAAAEDRLLALTGDPDPDVRVAVLEALGRMGFSRRD